MCNSYSGNVGWVMAHYSICGFLSVVRFWFEWGKQYGDFSQLLSKIRVEKTQSNSSIELSKQVFCSSSTKCSTMRSAAGWGSTDVQPSVLKDLKESLCSSKSCPSLTLCLQRWIERRSCRIWSVTPVSPVRHYMGAYRCSSVFDIQQNYSKCVFLNIKKIQMLPDSVVLCIVVEWSQIRRCVFIHPFQCHLLRVSLFLDCLLLFFGDQHRGWAVLSPAPASEWCQSLPESLVWGELHPENVLIPGIFCVLNNAKILYPLHPWKHLFFILTSVQLLG